MLLCLSLRLLWSAEETGEYRTVLKKIVMGAGNAKHDLEQYRKGYPGKEDDPEATKNKEFYKGEIKSTPDGGYIDEIHKKWFGEYHLLEMHHGYIQWYFSPFFKMRINFFFFFFFIKVVSYSRAWDELSFAASPTSRSRSH